MYLSCTLLLLEDHRITLDSLCILYQHITNLTHYRPGITSHTLDPVLTDEERMVDELGYLAALGK